jgi:hypothetical protein
MSVFKLKNCGLLGLDVDDIKLNSLDLGSSQKLIVVGPEADVREFQVAEVVYGGEYKEQKSCDNCTQLLKRVMKLTNLVFLHDHEQCQLESQQLRAEVRVILVLFDQQNLFGLSLYWPFKLDLILCSP